MFDIDIEKQEEIGGDWFDFPGGGRVKLRLLSTRDWRDIRQASTIRLEPAFTEVDGQMRRFDGETIDVDRQWEMSVDKNIVVWEGFFDRNEKEIPCTKENKLRLMEMESPAFRNFYDEKMKVLKATEAEKEGAEKKPLSTG